MSSSRAAPKPLMIPLVSVVFPLPRSPFKSTKTGGRSLAAISRPFEIVSSADCVKNSDGLQARPALETLTAMTALPQDARIRLRNRFDQLRRDEGRFAPTRRRDIARETMQVHAEAENPCPFLDPELCRQSSQDSG